MRKRKPYNPTQLALNKLFNAAVLNEKIYLYAPSRYFGIAFIYVTKDRFPQSWQEHRIADLTLDPVKDVFPTFRALAVDEAAQLIRQRISLP